MRTRLPIALLLLLPACSAPHPDVVADAARLTGLRNAITFRSNAPESGPPIGGVDVLTAESAVRVALAFDPRVQSALAKVRIAEAQAHQARLLPNPIIGIDVRFVVGSGGNQVFEPTIAEDLLSLLQKPATISAADQRLRGAVADALTVVLDLIAEVQQAYAAARSADEEIANAQRRQQLLEQLRTIARKRFDAGEGTKLDLLTLDAQVMQSQLDLSDAQLTRATERIALARLVGQPRAAADWQLSPWQPPTLTSPAPESAWIDAGLRNRPEVASKAWELRALGEDLAAASFAQFMGGDVGAHAERDPEWRVGPTLTIPFPLFDFGQATREKIGAQRVAARQDLQLQRLTVIQEIRTAHATYIAALQTLRDTQDKLLPLQRSQLDQAKISYQAGEADLATLLLAQTNFELALSKMIELRERVSVALIKLQRAAGGAAIAETVQKAP